MSHIHTYCRIEIGITVGLIDTMNDPSIDPSEAVRLFCQDYYSEDDNRAVRLLRERGFDDSQVLAILEVIEDCCQRCWKRGPGCHCWNDD